MRGRGAVLACLLLLAGCGGNDAADRVTDYVERANAIQDGVAADLARADVVYRQIAEGKVAPRRARLDVERAEDALRATRARVARLRPPTEARRLHRLLLAAFDANAELAEQTSVLVRYLPAAAGAVRPLDTAGARLRTRLAEAGEPAAQAGALGRYTRTIGRVLRQLRGLVAPRLLFESHQDQLRRLTEVQRLAGSLRDAVRSADAARIGRLVLRFQAASDPRRGAPELLRRSLRLYQRRQGEVDRVVAAVRTEQARLRTALD